MRWTTWCCLALFAVATTGCGGGGGGDRQNPPVSSDSNRPLAETVAASGECAELGSFFSELLSLTNKARQEAGMGRLRFSYQLGQAAQGYAEELATENFFSHTGKDGSTLSSRISATGYRFAAAGENLAAGQTTAASVFQGWMNSPGHRANILQSEFTEVGFGMFDNPSSSDYGRYWVQNLGKPSSSGSQEAVFIPNTCGLSLAKANSDEQTVAGISVGIHRSGGQSDRTLPISSHGQPTIPAELGKLAGDIAPLGNGLLPVGRLAAGIASSVASAEPPAETVPEPAMWLGLVGLGWVIVRGGAPG